MEKPQMSSLFEEHQKLGANFGEFAGWQIPLSYKGVPEEVGAVRKKAGLFDISHMGRILVWGPDAQEFLQRMVTGNIETLGNEKTLYTLLCKEDNGGIIDDLMLFKTTHLFLGDIFILIVNAVNQEKVLNHFRPYLEKSGFQVVIDDRQLATSMMALQGPESENILKNLEGLPQNLIPDGRNKFSGINLEEFSLLISRTGYTGEDGFEIIFPAVNAPTFWQKLIEAKAGTVTPCGLIARDILRIEAGLPLYGHEIDETITPIEAGLERFVDFDKGEFLGKPALEHQKQEGPKRKLVGFEVSSGRISRQGCRIVKDGEIVGFVTSGCLSPTVEKSIGMGYINPQFSQLGTEITIDLRETMHKAKMMHLPFYRREK